MFFIMHSFEKLPTDMKQCVKITTGVTSTLNPIEKVPHVKKLKEKNGSHTRPILALYGWKKQGRKAYSHS